MPSPPRDLLAIKQKTTSVEWCILGVKLMLQLALVTFPLPWMLCIWYAKDRPWIERVMPNSKNF